MSEQVLTITFYLNYAGGGGDSPANGVQAGE